MANETLSAAKSAKKDEFYTQYEDIQREVNAYLEFDPDTFRDKTVLLPCDDPEWSNFTKFFAQNFEMLGLKKLISTSYAADSKKRNYAFAEDYHQFTLFDVTEFESSSPDYDEKLTHVKGKIFTLTRDKNQSGNIDIDDLEWHYLDGDGDFRSEEVKALRDEAEIFPRTLIQYHLSDNAENACIQGISAIFSTLLSALFLCLYFSNCSD